MEALFDPEGKPQILLKKLLAINFIVLIVMGNIWVARLVVGETMPEEFVTAFQIILLLTASLGPFNLAARLIAKLRSD